MRVALLNTGTELLLGDVQDAHLAFIAREILSFGLRIEERRTVGDTEAIRRTLSELFPGCEILFVTGGLGPTADDITREMVADLLGLELQNSPDLLSSLRQRLRVRGIKWTSGIARQADVPAGAEVLPNQNGSAPGLYLRANINVRIQSPHLFLLPGPLRELQPMFRSFVMKAVEQADAIIRSTLGPSVFSAADETLEEVIVKLLVGRNQTLAVAESCTGGLLANRVTNVPGASKVFLAGYVSYANQAKINMLDVDSRLIEKHGAVSEQVALALAENARRCAGSDYALATTGIAGPGGGSPEKPVGTVYVALAGSGEAIAKKLFFPTDRETFKQIATQAALELLRRRLIVHM